MAGILCGRGSTVPKAPVPGDEISLSGVRLVRKLDCCRRTGYLQVGPECDTGEGVDGDVIIFPDGIGSILVTDDERDCIVSGAGIDNRGILLVGSLAIAEIPAPKNGIAGRLVGKLDVEGTTAGRWGSGKIRAGPLSTNFP